MPEGERILYLKSMATSNSERAHQWRTLARQTVTKVNAGWVLQLFGPVAIGLSLGLALAILLMRSFEVPFERFTFYLPVALVMVSVMLLTGWIAKKHFIGFADGLVRLEDRLKLKNQLTTANEGHLPWPEVPASHRGDGFVWRWPVVTAPFLLSSLMIAAAALIPVTNLLEARPEVEEPLARKQMEDWLKQIREDGVVEEEALTKYEEKIEELRGQPEEEWFSHSALEATDSLREGLAKDIRDMGGDLATAERNMNALQEYGAEMGSDSREKLLDEYEQAITDLALGGLPLSKEMQEMLAELDMANVARGGNLDALKQLAGATGMNPQQLKEALQKLQEAMNDPNGANLGQKMAMQAAMQKLMAENPELFQQAKAMMLTEQQLQQMREAMKQAAENAKAMMGQKGGLPALAELSPEALAALLGRQPGRGGVQRGLGPAPMFLGDETDLSTNQLEMVQNPDFSRALPGQLTGIGETQHDETQTPAEIRAAGEAKSLGQGGEAVWKESLLPSEKAVLKRYFK